MPSGPKYRDLRMVSSRKTEAALVRLGCEFIKSRGTHQTVVRMVDGNEYYATLVLKQKAMKRGTLQTLLTKLDISAQEFNDAVR